MVKVDVEDVQPVSHHIMQPQVLEAGGFYPVLDQLLQDTSDQSIDNLCPRQLLTSASFRLCIREVYRNETQTDTPLEYVQQNADFHFPLTRTLALNTTELWAFVSSKVLQPDDIWK